MMTRNHYMTVSTLALVLCVAGRVLQDPQPARQSGGEQAATADPHIAALRAAARARVATDQRYNNADGPAARVAAHGPRIAAKDALDGALAAFEAAKGRSLLLDATALAEVFEDVFVPTEAPPDVGATTLLDPDGQAHVVLVPAGYEASRSWVTVCLLAGREQRGDPAAVQAYLESTWGEAARRESMIVMAPIIDRDLDADALLAEGPAKRDAEQQSLAAVLGPLGKIWRQLHSSRERVVLDCGRGASAFGLRLVSLFPDRFAGVVLRWPTPDDKLRVAAVRGIPVLLLRCPDTAVACDRLYTRLNEQAPGSCQVLTPPGEYPYAGEIGIAEWSRQQRRDAMAKHVVVAPIHDRFHSNRWVRIRKADPVSDAPWHGAPSVEAVADPKRNRIAVTARGVQEVELLLGPALVDVREFTLVVNGVQQKVSRKPSLSTLLQHMTRRFDPGHLVTAQYRIVLP